MVDAIARKDEKVRSGFGLVVAKILLVNGWSGVSVLVGPLAIRHSRRKEKASKTEKVCLG